MDVERVHEFRDQTSGGRGLTFCFIVSMSLSSIQHLLLVVASVLFGVSILVLRADAEPTTGLTELGLTDVS